MEKLTYIRSKTIVLPQTDIDTDQIMPARLPDFDYPGRPRANAVFADWRFDDQRQPVSQIFR